MVVKISDGGSLRLPTKRAREWYAVSSVGRDLVTIVDMVWHILRSRVARCCADKPRTSADPAASRIERMRLRRSSTVNSTNPSSLSVAQSWRNGGPMSGESESTFVTISVRPSIPGISGVAELSCSFRIRIEQGQPAPRKNPTDSLSAASTWRSCFASWRGSCDSSIWKAPAKWVLWTAVECVARYGRNQASETYLGRVGGGKLGRSIFWGSRGTGGYGELTLKARARCGYRREGRGSVRYERRHRRQRSCSGRSGLGFT